MPIATLLRVSCDTREIEHVTRDPTALGRSLVTIQLSPTGHLDLLGIEACIMSAEPPERSLIDPEVILVVLSKREGLDARLDFQVRVIHLEPLHNRTHVEDPLGIETEPSDPGSINEEGHPPVEKLDIILIRQLVLVLSVLQPDVVRGIGEDASGRQIFQLWNDF